MKTVNVKASKSYDIYIEGGLLKSVGERLCSLGKVKKAAIVSDSNVFPIYGKTVKSSIEKTGINCVSYVFEAGEKSKNGDTFLRLLNFLAENRLSRTDAVVALGGGVVGDMAGFAASAYLRGIRYIGVPTTLLSAVDSSVGGKTAIDLDAGKNLAGAFYQPSMVICDTDAFNTLGDDIFADGCAEVIKYGAIMDGEFFKRLDGENIKNYIDEAVERCVALKAQVVLQDEFDTGLRQLLNFGHTAAHGIEKLSGYKISHGSAVAAGMAIITRAAADMGICGKRCAVQIEEILKKYSLPINTEFTAKELAEVALSDKKISGESINLVVPKSIGECILRKTPVSELCEIFERGL